MMLCSADRQDRSVECQAQAYRIVAQQKSGPLYPLGGGVGEDAPIALPLPAGLIHCITQSYFPETENRKNGAKNTGLKYK